MATSQALSVQPPLQIERFVNAETAAMFLGISRRNLLQKVRAGKIPAHPLDPAAQKKEWRFKLRTRQLPGQYSCRQAATQLTEAPFV